MSFKPGMKAFWGFIPQWPKRRDTSPVLPGRLYVKIWS